MGIVLAAITDKLELVTSEASSVDVNVTYVDVSDATGPTSIAMKQETAISIAATTSILASSAAGTPRNVKQISIRNKDALLSNDVTLRLSRNAALFELHKQTLLPGETMAYVEGLGFITPKRNLSDDRAIATAKSRSISVNMEDTTTYRKTDKGVREVADRAFKLEQHLRRLLIMVDGNRDVAELSVYVRAGEFKSTLIRLVAEGFIEMVSAGDQIPGRVTYAPAANDPVVFAGIKVRAMADIHGRLGPVSNLLVTEIDSCSSPLELREKLRNLENALVHLLGRVEGVALARRIGSELTQLIPQTTPAK
jgi:hypothetical protein